MRKSTMQKICKFYMLFSLLFFVGCNREGYKNDLISNKLLAALSRALLVETRSYFPKIEATTFFSDYYMLTNKLCLQKISYAQNSKLSDCIVPFFVEIAEDTRNQSRQSALHSPRVTLKFWGIGPGYVWSKSSNIWLIVTKQLPTNQTLLVINTLQNIYIGCGYSHDTALNFTKVRYRCINPFNVFRNDFLLYLNKEIKSKDLEIYILIGDGYSIGARIGNYILDKNVYLSKIHWLVEQGYLFKLTPILDNGEIFIFRCSQSS